MARVAAVSLEGKISSILKDNCRDYLSGSLIALLQEALDRINELNEELAEALKASKGRQQAEDGKHVCDTVEEGWRPCPASFCEGLDLLAELEKLRSEKKSLDE